MAEPVQTGTILGLNVAGASDFLSILSMTSKLASPKRLQAPLRATTHVDSGAEYLYVDQRYPRCWDRNADGVCDSTH